MDLITLLNAIFAILVMGLLLYLIKVLKSRDLKTLILSIEELKREQERIDGRLHMELSSSREETSRLLRDQRIELSEAANKIKGDLVLVLKSMEERINTFRNTMDSKLREIGDQNDRKLTEIRKTVDDTLINLLERQRTELISGFSKLREEVVSSLKQVSDTIFNTLRELSRAQQDQLFNFTAAMKELTSSMENRLEILRGTVDTKLKEIQDSSTRQLEEIRKNVNERLSDTLEKKLGDSFKLVSERLEAVHKGLGEMQTLAAGVGDLKRVLSNVKVRGTWAEVQLESILEQILTPEQYEKNVAVKPNATERVEFAIKLPGRKSDTSEVLWLPIDSKFPQEDYLRLQEAVEKGDPELMARACDSLKKTAIQSAKAISEKYIAPPHTTDFAVMFLATEGLFAELLRQPGLVEELQVRYRVIPSGPTTLGAILSGLRMGFHTLAIEKRASEVWRLLGAVKTEFRRFGENLEKVKKHLESASRNLEDTGTRTRAMERKLRAVEEVPPLEAERIFGLEGPGDL